MVTPRHSWAALALAIAIPALPGCVATTTTATANLKASQARGSATPAYELSAAVECRWGAKSEKIGGG